MRRIFCNILFLVLITNSEAGCQDDASIRVLFVGNSYTYYHSMPQLFSAMAETHFPDQQVDVKFVGRGGATLKQLWENGEALKEIRSGRWNYVILQEQSMLGEEIIENGKSYIRSPDQFYKYAAIFTHISREYGAKPVFYMTWSQKEYPHQQKYLSYSYMTIARETGSKIAPAGLAWDKLRSTPGFDLYERDGSHPSIYGSYLSALVLFSVIFDTDPARMPGRLEGYEILRDGGISDEKILLCDLPKNRVVTIQNTASNLFQEMKQGNGYLEVEKAVSDKKPSQFSIILDYLNDSKNQFIILMVTVGMIVIVKKSVLLFKKKHSYD